jgi:hypothetical protein
MAAQSDSSRSALDPLYQADSQMAWSCPIQQYSPIASRQIFSPHVLLNQRGDERKEVTGMLLRLCRARKGRLLSSKRVK